MRKRGGRLFIRPARCMKISSDDIALALVWQQNDNVHDCSLFVAVWRQVKLYNDMVMYRYV